MLSKTLRMSSRFFTSKTIPEVKKEIPAFQCDTMSDMLDEMISSPFPCKRDPSSPPVIHENPVVMDQVEMDGNPNSDGTPIPVYRKK